MKTYKVTIGIPVYNVEKYIRQTMDSVLAQTFEDIEILICDDSGTDSSIDIIKEYQNNHPRGSDICILSQPYNKGIGAARNLILANAHGRYLYFLDADDVIEPQTIGLLYNTAQEYKAEIVYGSYDRIYTNYDKIVKTVPYPYPHKVFTEPDTYADYVYNVGVQGMNWNYLIDIDIIRSHHLQVTPVAHGYGEDFTFTVDLPTYITRAVLLPDITYHYYIRGIDKHFRKKVLSYENMETAIKALEDKKNRKELKDRSYYGKRISVLMMLCCSFACQTVAKRKEFDRPFSNKEIRRAMSHPMTFWEVLNTKSGRFHNLFYWTIGNAPSFLSVWLLKLMIKRYGMKMV